MVYEVNNKISPPKDLFKIRLNGVSAPIMERFFEKRVFSDFAKNVIYKEAEDAFRTQVDDEKYIGLWQGEFWGKLMLSAVEVCKYTSDEELKDFLKNAAHNILLLARSDGYINTYRDSLNVFPADPEKALKLCGKAFDWNWNIWCRKYTLWGLIAIYELTCDKSVLEGAVRLADHLINELSENSIELRKTGTFNGLPSCSILKPMMLLYGITGNKKYYNFCKCEIIDNWQREDNAIPNIISNAISGKAISEWYPESNRWAKAYEMMSCFEGIAEFYRYSGDEVCRKALESFYEILIKHERNPLFSVAYNDVFGDAADSVNAISEPCDAIHFMRVCYELYLLTGDKKYMDSIELTYYNAFLAGVFRDGEWGSRAVRSAGRHMWGHQANTKYQHCCVNNMPRAFVRFAESTVMYDQDSVIINMYEALSANLDIGEGNVSVSVSDGYFSGKPVTVAVKYCGILKKIKLRIPAWCENLDAVTDDKSERANGYLVVTPSSPECVIKLYFNMKARIISLDQMSDSSWQFDRWYSNYMKACSVPKELYLKQKRCTVMYGPLLLAKCKRLGNTEEDIFYGEPIDSDCSAEIKPIDNLGEVNYAYDIEFKKNGASYKTNVCDYASAGNEKLEDDRFFCIYF